MTEINEPTKGYTGDHKSWKGEACKECGKNHPAWVHKPEPPVQTARRIMAKQMRNTAYVFANPTKYDKTRQAASMALLELRIAEYEVAVATRTSERIQRLEAKHEEARDDSEQTELDLDAAKIMLDAYNQLPKEES